MRTSGAGWKQTPVWMLGKRSRAGGDSFRAGYQGQIRAVRLPMNDTWGVFAADDLGNALLFGKIMTQDPELLPLRYVWKERPDELRERICEVSGGPNYYCYMAALPRGTSAESSWDILRCSPYEGSLTVARKCDSASPNLHFYYEDPVAGSAHGCPELIDWKRDGVYDLLVGTDEGKLIRYPQDRTAAQLGFLSGGEPILVGNLPMEEGLQGRLCPCVVDWEKNGKSDLLVGTGDGYVMLYRDVGDENEVALARGRRLVAEDGFVNVDGPASPTLYEEGGNRYLLVSDRAGVVWSWPLNQVKSLVTDDLVEAFGGEASGISRTYKKASWWIHTDAQGSLLCAGPSLPGEGASAGADPVVPPLLLKTAQSGTYEIYLNMRLPEGASGSVCDMRLSDESCGEYMAGGEAHKGKRQRVFFKAADMKERDIHIRQYARAHAPDQGHPVYIESVQLVPVKKTPGVKRSVKPLIGAILDTPAWTRDVKTDTHEDVDAFMEKHYRAGFDRVYFKTAGGYCEYPSRYPDAQNVIPDHYIYDEPKLQDNLKKYSNPDVRASVQSYIELMNRINRLEACATACRKRGMQLFGWIRVQNHGESWGRNPIDRFFMEHQHLQEKTRDGGIRHLKLCLAYPEVEDFYARIATEAVDLGASGIMIDTLRHMPKVCYGDPIVKEFKERYGTDMRALSPVDQRVMDMQGEVFARFLRAIRAAIRSKDPQAQLHVRICRPYPLGGVNPRRLAEEGLVDSFILEHRSPGPCREPDIAGLVRELKGTACIPCACFGRPHWKTSEYPLHDELIEAKTRDYLNAGAGPIAFYETGYVIKCPEMRRGIRRLKSPAEMPSHIPP